MILINVTTGMIKDKAKKLDETEDICTKKGSIKKLKPNPNETLLVSIERKTKIKNKRRKIFGNRARIIPDEVEPPFPP